jgi:hypothetical protein
MGEKETIDLVMAEGWPEELLDLCNRGNLAKKVLGNLKVIEDRSVYRLEELSYPETKFLTIYITDRKDSIDHDLIVGKNIFTF